MAQAESVKASAIRIFRIGRRVTRTGDLVTWSPTKGVPTIDEITLRSGVLSVPKMCLIVKWPAGVGFLGVLVRGWIAFIALVLMAGSAAGQTGARHLSGEVSPTTPRVSFPIQVEAGQVLTLTTSSVDGLDTVLTLNGPNGRRVAMNDDVQPGILTSRIVHVAREAGSYTAIVSGYNGARGQFDLDIAYGAGADLSAEARVLLDENVTRMERMNELLRLRVQDIEFDQNRIVVRAGKNDKDRYVPLPTSQRGDLQRWLADRKVQYEADKAEGKHEVINNSCMPNS